MKRLIVVAGLLLAVSAHAATYTLDFSAPYPTPYPAGGVVLHWQPMGTVTNAYFGGVWRRGWDCDQIINGVYVNTCHPCTGQGYYVPTPSGGPPGRQREDDSGDFANEPSPGAVAWLPSGWPGSNGGHGDSAAVIFDHDMKYCSFWYSSSLSYEFWCNGSDSCGYGAHCNLSGPLDGGATVRFASLSPLQLVGVVNLDQPGTRTETGCVGDPLGSACRWTKVTFSSQTPFRELYFDIGALGPFFMDDLTVGDQPTVSVDAAPESPSLRSGIYDIAGRKLDRPPATGVYFEVKKGQPKRIVVVK